MRQFLDVGTGLPTANNTHQVAQGVAPESKIVYADNDPLVLATPRPADQQPRGACEYLTPTSGTRPRSWRRPAPCWTSSSRSALMLMGIMGHFTDDEAYPIVSQLVAGCRPAATSRSTTARTPTRRSRRHRRATTTAARCPITCAARRVRAVLRGAGTGLPWRGADGAVAAGPGHRAGPDLLLLRVARKP